ncbi:MAG TPA: RidA family protein [Actinomycetota bacterium]|nr:RidA family protein [Actinomycetota bacterium]
MVVERIDATDVLGPSPGYAYAAAATEGVTVYTAGAVPVDPNGKLLGPDDLKAQTQACIANLRTVLERAGAAPDMVVKTTIFVVGAKQSDLPEVWSEFARTPWAAAPSTLVGVTYLGYSGQLVEIEAVAVVPSER